MSEDAGVDPEPHVLHKDDQGWWDHRGECPCVDPNDHQRDGGCDEPPPPPPPPERLPVA